MTTVHDILCYMESLAPTEMKTEWDNTGLLCGHSQKCVKKILVALDPFEDTCKEAVAKQADLLITHHPLIFGQGLTAVNDSSETGRSLLTLSENGIAAINAHTNLDCATGGVNDVLAEAIGLQDTKTVMFPERNYGLLRHGYVAEQNLNKMFFGVLLVAPRNACLQKSKN